MTTIIGSMPLPATDFWRDTTVARALPDGTTDVSQGIVHNGPVHMGASTLNTAQAQGFRHDAIVSYASATGLASQVITTTIPANSIIMPAIFIKGYAYETGNTVDLQLGFYTYNAPANATINTVWTSTGSAAPLTIRAGYLGGFLQLELTWGALDEYFLRYEVSAYCDSAASAAEHFQGWTVAGGAFGATTDIVTMVRKVPNICPGPMTRAQLALLRSGSQLNPTCHYIVTDFVQGRFLAGTTLTLHADSASELSMSGTINSLYDNSGWACRYDLDTNNLTMVADNLGNVVESDAVGRVAAWDWGNANMTRNQVQGLVTTTYGSAHPFIGNTVARYGSIDLTGRTGGSMLDTSVSGQVNLINSNLSVLRSTVESNSSINAIGYAAGGTGIINTTLANTTGIVIGAAAGAVNITNCDFRNGGGTSINHTGTGALTLTNTSVSNTAVVTHSSTGALTMAGAVVYGASTAILHTTGPGAMTFAGGEFGPYARVYKNDPASTGTLVLSQCAVRTGGAIIQQAANNIAAARLDIDSEGFVSTSVGANTALTIVATKISSGAYVNMATTASGTASVASTSLNSGGFIGKSGAGTLTVQAANITGTGRVNHTGGRGLSVANATLSNIGRIDGTATGPAATVDIVQYATVTDYGVVTLSATGAATNQLLYSSIMGVSASATFSGTTTGHVVSRLTLLNGTFSSANNTVAQPNCFANTASNFGNIVISGCTAAQDVRYNSVGESSQLNLTNKTVAASVQFNNLRSAGQLNMSAAAGSATYCSIEHGPVTSTGGTLQYVKKSLSGTLNTNTRACANIVHESGVSVTLTVANTARATRIGVTNTAPLL
jgi:hypothetical protein